MVWYNQGPHAFLSNLYAADVDMEVENGETITFNSNEQALAYSCAIHHNQHEAAQQILKVKDPFDVKRSFHKISKNTEWELKERAVIEKLVNLKFNQNRHLAEKLLKIEGHIYEGTLSYTYGCGFLLRDAASVRQGVVASQRNQMGRILEATRHQLLSANPTSDT